MCIEPNWGKSLRSTIALIDHGILFHSTVNPHQSVEIEINNKFNIGISISKQMASSHQFECSTFVRLATAHHITLTHHCNTGSVLISYLNSFSPVTNPLRSRQSPQSICSIAREWLNLYRFIHSSLLIAYCVASSLYGLLGIFCIFTIVWSILRFNFIYCHIYVAVDSTKVSRQHKTTAQMKCSLDLLYLFPSIDIIDRGQRCANRGAVIASQEMCTIETPFAWLPRTLKCKLINEWQVKSMRRLRAIPIANKWMPQRIDFIVHTHTRQRRDNNGWSCWHEMQTSSNVVYRFHAITSNANGAIDGQFAGNSLSVHHLFIPSTETGLWFNYFSNYDDDVRICFTSINNNNNLKSVSIEGFN